MCLPNSVVMPLCVRVFYFSLRFYFSFSFFIAVTFGQPPAPGTATAPAPALLPSCSPPLLLCQPGLPFLLFFAHNFIVAHFLGGLFLWLHIRALPLPQACPCPCHRVVSLTSRWIFVLFAGLTPTNSKKDLRLTPSCVQDSPFLLSSCLPLWFWLWWDFFWG